VQEQQVPELLRGRKAGQLEQPAQVAWEPVWKAELKEPLQVQIREVARELGAPDQVASSLKEPLKQKGLRQVQGESTEAPQG
jgi:hypothetical protein